MPCPPLPRRAAGLRFGAGSAEWRCPNNHESNIHTLHDVFKEMNRVLRPDGHVLTAFHRGHGELHEDEVWSKRVSFDCTLFEPNEVAQAMEEAGLSIAETTIRRSYETEYPTQRVYVLADKGTG